MAILPTITIKAQWGTIGDLTELTDEQKKMAEDAREFLAKRAECYLHDLAINHLVSLHLYANHPVTAEQIEHALAQCTPSRNNITGYDPIEVAKQARLDFVDRFIVDETDIAVADDSVFAPRPEYAELQNESIF